MQTPDNKSPNSRLALRQGIDRTRQREIAANQLRMAGLSEVPDALGTPPTVTSIVAGRSARIDRTDR